MLRALTSGIPQFFKETHQDFQTISVCIWTLFPLETSGRRNAPWHTGRQNRRVKCIMGKLQWAKLRLRVSENLDFNFPLLWPWFKIIFALMFNKKLGNLETFHEYFTTLPHGGSFSKANILFRWLKKQHYKWNDLEHFLFLVLSFFPKPSPKNQETNQSRKQLF